ncbi:MAG: hypothetical protein QOC54_3962, partial [Baekduia sp.]|nr:hypothetical protein [Baekduia sp.]
FTAPRIADLAGEVDAAMVPGEAGDAELAALLEELEGISDDDAEKLLEAEGGSGE